MATVREQLLSSIKEPMTVGKNKITIVGVGQVGMACAFGILASVSNLKKSSNLNKLRK